MPALTHGNAQRDSWAATRWCFADPSLLSWREWDGEIVLYDGASGDVHRLEGVAAEVFETLLGGAFDLEALTGRIATALDVEPSPDLTNAIGFVLREWHISGIIQPAEA